MCLAAALRHRVPDMWHSARVTVATWVRFTYLFPFGHILNTVLRRQSQEHVSVDISGVRRDSSNHTKVESGYRLNQYIIRTGGTWLGLPVCQSA